MVKLDGHDYELAQDQRGLRRCYGVAPAKDKEAAYNGRAGNILQYHT